MHGGTVRGDGVGGAFRLLGPLFKCGGCAGEFVKSKVLMDCEVSMDPICFHYDNILRTESSKPVLDKKSGRGRAGVR